MRNELTKQFESLYANLIEHLTSSASVYAPGSGVLLGDSGKIFLLIFFKKYRKKDIKDVPNTDPLVHQWIENEITKINSTDNHDFNYGTGISGFSWLISYANNHKLIDDYEELADTPIHHVKMDLRHKLIQGNFESLRGIGFKVKF